MHWLLCAALGYVVMVAARSRQDAMSFQQYDSLQEAEPLWRDEEDRSAALYDILDRMERGPDTSEMKSENKRALSILSRWRPFGSIGMRVNSINKMPQRAPLMSMVPELDFVSAETRGILRPIGQPLRWGRRR